MKKITFLFLMVVGMTLASVNVNAQDAKSTTTPAKKEATTCCKSGEKMADGKTCSKEAAAACANKGASTASADKPAACCKSKAGATASDAKSTKTID
ncbi:MAG TPA: hypothetical protein VFC67_05915 [Prolixibacteraceae bacterium]|nr:hypothetical protein [Prolixibacteraceae bacterium]